MCKTIILQSYQKRNRLQNKSRPIFISFYFIFSDSLSIKVSISEFLSAGIRTNVCKDLPENKSKRIRCYKQTQSLFYDNILQKIKSLNNEDTLK